MARRIVLIPLFLSLTLAFAVGETEPALGTLFQHEYPTLVLISFAKGNFTGSDGQEYLAFYEDPRQRFEKDSPRVVWQVVVFIVRNGVITGKYELHNLGLYTLDYTERELSIIRDSRLHFGRWVGYAYVGDYNDNGLEEILFFQLSGMSFLPTIVEFDGKGFVNVLEFSTTKNQLSEMETLTRDGKKLLKLYGYGTDYSPKGKRDWYLYQWSAKAKRYEIVEKGLE